MSKSYIGNKITPEKIVEYWVKLKPSNNMTATEEETWKIKAEFLDKVSVQNNVVVFLTNMHTGRFIYMSDKVNILSGLDPSLFTGENGMEFSFSRFHPEQIQGLMQLHSLGMKYFEENELYKDKNSFLSATYLYKNGNGEYVQVLQRTIMLETEAGGKPLLTLNIIHYVGHIIKHGSLNYIISVGDKVDIYSYNNSSTIEKPKTFSLQENKILKMLARGLDSKAIAKELFISPHTVDSHRRSIIKKTNCIDTTGVVAFAQLINLI
jgi:DNA-binding CsgD family transcriptional regulator